MRCALLVDDEQGIRDALASYLALQGVATETAASAAAARSRIADQAPAWLVCDEDLGDGSGRAVIDAYLAASTDGSALLYTALLDERIDRWRSERPRVTVMQKPVRPSALHAWIREQARVGQRSVDGDDVASAFDGLRPEARDRSMLAVLPLLGIARIEQVLDEATRVRILLVPHAPVPPRIVARLPRELGADAWTIETATGPRIVVVVPLPAATAPVIDLHADLLEPLESIVQKLEHAARCRARAANLAPWHLRGLVLARRFDLLALCAADVAANTETDPGERASSLLWQDG